MANKSNFWSWWVWVGLILAVGALIYLWFSGGLVSQDDRGQITNDPSSAQNVDYEIVELVTGLEVPWAIAFTNPDRMLVTERPGRIRVVEDGKLIPEPLHTISQVVAQSESGLMGLTIDPDYARNRYVYTVYTYRDNTLYDKVVRFTDRGDSLTDETTIIDKIPAASNHAGSRIKFGPDSKLYITTGDATDRSIAQDVGNLGGKILRLNPDGSIPSDNPFPDSPVWSLGHRNPQGIDWHDENGSLYQSEHGPSGFDGPGGGDEINLIIKGANYGWPEIHHGESREGMVSPLVQYTPAEAPSGLLVYSGKSLPQFKNNIFVSALRGQGLLRLTLSDDGSQVLATDKMAEIKFGRIREVIESPAGDIYFTTSNRDGRGSPDSSDDRIFVIRPK